ncbi:aldo/keto reductase [Gynurincola endophyticus]|uniref:aldo/keto reductase n=1 Tax=Gynurincola endophyticus TaxID=2479004 RepID=UPI000F8D4E53|nr:aldo/keto reductase [Gynurincola endophyticus]
MKQLGNSSLSVSDLIVGGNVFGWTIGEEKSFELLDAWLAHDINTIDTSDNYSHWGTGLKGGESETVLGHWIKKRKCRSRVVIATKFGGTYSENTSRNISAAYARQAIDRSLKRLQTDYIDLYQVHHDDEQTSVEETIEVLNEFVLAGKVRAIGVSNMNAGKIAASIEYSRLHQLAAYVSIQPEYNLVFRDKYEQQYAALAEKYGLGVMPYFSLASGFLSGKYRRGEEALLQTTARKDFVRKYINDDSWKVLECLEMLSKKKNQSMASIAIRWVMQQTGVTAPIVSATSIEQLHDLVSVRTFELSAGEINDLK